MIDRSLIEKALAWNHPKNWVSSMSSASLRRPRKRPADLAGKERRAAVMLLLFPGAKNDELQTVLTRRPETLQHHPGQISLPGGRQEPGEPIQTTALREVEEEIGVNRSQITVLGTLTQIYVPPSDFTVTPFVGWADREPTFQLQEDEVAELIYAPLLPFMDSDNRNLSPVDNDTQNRDVPWFAVARKQIWGATAIIIDDLVQRIEAVNATMRLKP
jgi:8-oxo-dGTP pyrophosphatase MutT (NUDIX family)